MPQSQQIEDKVRAYASGELSLDEFEEWFVPTTWHVDTRSDDAGQMVGEILVLLADVKDGEISEDEFRSELLQEVPFVLH